MHKRSACTRVLSYRQGETTCLPGTFAFYSLFFIVKILLYFFYQYGCLIIIGLNQKTNLLLLSYLLRSKGKITETLKKLKKKNSKCLSCTYGCFLGILKFVCANYIDNAPSLGKIYFVFHLLIKI